MIKKVFRRHNLFLKVLPYVCLVVVIKYFVHMMGYEFLELNALFTSFVAANVFLLGFLMSGVLADYKESEKLPGEIAISLESIADEADQLYKTKHLPAAKECIDHIDSILRCINSWFQHKERTREVFEHLAELNAYFTAFEPYTQANYLVRLKQEQTNLRRLITRIDAIRDTAFIGSGYRIVEINSVILLIGLIFLTIDPFTTALFLTGSIALLFVYLLALIKDIDNPFGFAQTDSIENVSLRALVGLEKKLNLLTNNNKIMESNNDTLITTNNTNFKMSDNEQIKQISNISRNKKLLISAIVFASLLIISAFLFTRGYIVAATVNGSPISRLEIISELEKQGGKQALEAKINEKIVNAEFNNLGITVADEAVAEEIKKIEAQVVAQGGTLEEALSQQSMTMEVLKDQIVSQLKIEQVLGDKIKVSDEEIKAFMKENDVVPPAGADNSAIEKQIAEKLKQDKMQTAATAWIKDVTDKAKITYYVNY